MFTLWRTYNTLCEMCVTLGLHTSQLLEHLPKRLGAWVGFHIGGTGMN